MADKTFFDNKGPFSLEEILSKTKAVATAGGLDPARLFSDVAPLDKAGAGHVSFLDNIKYRDQFAQTQAGACFCTEDMVAFAPESALCLVTKTPYKAYALAAQMFYPIVNEQGAISPHAVIEEGAEIGENTVIEAGAVIGRNVKIGSYCWIGANASISHAHIGDYTRIYPGVRIGQDGFGFAIDPAGHVKVPQLGRVMIGSHVEIGANSCVDRGAGPDTVIGDGTWIDNLVQIGHNVKIGRGCILIAQSGIAGSTVLEDYAVVAAQGGVAGHLRIGMGAQIGAQSGVMRDVAAGEKVLGSPAQPIKEYMRQVAFLKKAIKK
ncbi:MAG: UDP-3-O-(3-hydroxymyristoyl)glucosamine N-acyltransferase [Rhodospirillales bacterium]|nr:UDP-3-O-(3-hydroxymyristoyl)glucosamine N-acyltransferase [Rhodospirillales bacterium]